MSILRMPKLTIRDKIGLLFLAGSVALLLYVIEMVDHRPGMKSIEARMQMESFKQILGDNKLWCGTYPNSQQGLQALVEKSSVPPDCPNYPTGRFIKEGRVPLDSWDRPYS